MIKEYKEITELAVNFVTNHWSELDWYGLTGEDITLDAVVSDITKNYKTASWVLSEVMVWATETNYAEAYRVALDMNACPIYKIDEKCFSMNFELFVFQECVYFKCVCDNMIVKFI